MRSLVDTGEHYQSVEAMREFILSEIGAADMRSVLMRHEICLTPTYRFVTFARFYLVVVEIGDSWNVMMDPIDYLDVYWLTSPLHSGLFCHEY